MSNEFSKGTVSLLQSAIEVATILGIEKMVIDSHSVRGESKDNGTFMLLPFPPDMELEFGSIGITRIPVFNQRMKLIGEQGSLTPDYKDRDSGDKFVFRIVLKKGRTKIDFKCADPAHIRAPKAFNDPEYFSFTVTPDDIDLMLKAKAAMQSENVTFASKDGKVVKFSISASEGDVLDHELESELDTKTPTETFASSYKSKILFPVLRSIIDDAKQEAVTVTLTKRGIMKIDVNDIPTYIFPEV